MTHNNRIEYIDLAKGICILSVVAAHAINFVDWHSMMEYDFFRACRMPLYYLLSGLFFKTYGGLKNLIVKKVNKLLLPFFTFLNFISIPLSIIDRHQISSIYNWILGSDYPMYNGPLWFLLSLFEINLLFYILHYFAIIRKNSIILLGMLCLLFSQIGFWSGVYGAPNILYIGSTFTALIYFFEGYLLKNYTDWLTDSKIDQYILVIIVLGVFLLVSCGGDADYFANLSGIPTWRFYLCGMLGPLSILALSKYIGYIPGVSYIGRYSIVILCVHYIVISIISPWIVEMPIGYFGKFLLVFFISIFISVLAIPVLKKYAPWTIAQQDLIKF